MSVFNLTHVQTEKAALFYKLCARIVKLDELSDDDLLRVSTITKLFKNVKTKEIRWSVDWIAMGLTLSKAEHKQLWHRIAEHVHQAPVNIKELPNKTLKIDYSVFAQPELSMLEFIVEGETAAQNVYNIYEATGKVVHAIQLSDFLAGKTPAKPSEEIIQMMKSLKLPVSELRVIQSYILNSIKARAKSFRVSDMLLPKELYEILEKYSKQDTKITSAATLKEYTTLATLGLQGYTLAIVEPVYNKENDVAFYKCIEKCDLEDFDVLAKAGLERQYIFGLEYTGVPNSNRPVLTFKDMQGNHKLTPSIYLDALASNYKQHRELIKKYLETPKRFYIKRTDKYEWNHLAIALDILHNENILVHPDTFYLTKSKFGNRDPMEWINEI